MGDGKDNSGIGRCGRGGMEWVFYEKGMGEGRNGSGGLPEIYTCTI